MSTKYLDYSGLAYFWGKLKALFGTKADKVANATNGNFAGLDANGNLTDSGKKASDFTKVEASNTNGNIKIDSVETTVYSHPTTTAAAAAAVKVGKDSEGHVVLGDALAKADVGLGNVDNTSDETKKANFTGSVSATSTGFVRGMDVYSYMELKADKVDGSPNGKLAGLNAEGNLTDSGKLITDVTKVEASDTNGHISIDGVDTTVYTHPVTSAAIAAAKKVGKDTFGHVVLGDDLTKSDVGLGNVDNTSDATKKSNFTGSIANQNTGFVTGGDVYLALSDKIDVTEKGAAYGVATLDASGLVPSSQLPSYVDDVIEAYPLSSATELSSGWLSKTASGAALTPETGKIYVLMADSTSYSTNTQFRWGGTAYVKLNDGGVSAITNAEIDTIMAS